MSTNEIFKTELRGYSKKEVIDYIKTLNTQAESLEQELINTEKELKRCKEELNDTKQEYVPEHSKEEIRQQLRKELEPILRKQIYDEIKNQVESERTPVTVIDTSGSELDELRTKAALYDEQKDLLADLMIKSKTDAAKAYEDARTKSSDLMKTALGKFEKMREDFEEMRKNVVLSKGEIDSRISTMNRYLNDFTQYLDIMERDIANTSNNFKKEIKFEE